MAKKKNAVRMQVPVTEDLAAELAYLAERLDRSVAWLTAAMLACALENRKHMSEQLAMLIYGLLGNTKKLLTGKRRRRAAEQGQVRLQLSVKAEVADEINAIADSLNVTPAKAAALLLQSAYRDQNILIELAGSRLVQAIFGKSQTESPLPGRGTKAMPA